MNIVLQEDLTIDDLHDAKHVKIRSLRKLVKNMKDKMRAVVGEPHQRTNHNDGEESEEELRTSSSVIPSNRRSTNASRFKETSPRTKTNQGQKLVEKILQSVQMTNETLVNGLNSLASLL